MLAFSPSSRSSVQSPVMSDSLCPHEPQHVRLPCPSPTPEAYSNSCPSSQWCHPTISYSVIPFSSHLQSFPASGSFPVSQFFTWGNWRIGVSASAAVLLMNIQNWFPLGLTGIVSLQSKGLKSFLQLHSSKASIIQPSAFFMVPLSHPYMTIGETIALTTWTLVGKVMTLLFNMLSKFIIAFLPRREHLLISWLLSPSSVILEPKKRKSVTVFIVSHLFAMNWWNQLPWSWLFWMLSFKPAFSPSSFTFIKILFSSCLLSYIRVVSSAYLRLLTFLPATRSYICLICLHIWTKTQVT